MLLVPHPIIFIIDNYMTIKITLVKSPRKEKKFRVILPDGKKVDFGQRGYSDFTLHKNPLRMRSYVRRHGGSIPKYILNENNPTNVGANMLKVTRSDKEDWKGSGVDTAGVWSRWVLWSHPTIPGAIRIIERKFGVNIRQK